MQPSVWNIAGNRRNRKLIQLLALPLLISSVFLSGSVPAAIAEATIRGCPEPSEQFAKVPHEDLRFLADLMPGYVMAQRISDRAEVIVEIKNGNVKKLWQIDKVASRENRGLAVNWLRYWIADSHTQIIDPRDYLLIAIENTHVGLKNANGKVIIPAIYHSIDMGKDFQIVALKFDDMQTRAELHFFNSAGKLISKKSNLGAGTSGRVDQEFVVIQKMHTGDEEVKKGLMNTSGVLIYPEKLTLCMILNGIAHACEIVDSQCFYLAIDINGKTLRRSLDENEVYKTEKTAHDKQTGTEKSRKTPHLRVDIERVQHNAEADHSLDTEHFTPSVWSILRRPAEGPRTAEFAGFLQDHKIMGMTRVELEKLLGKGTENVFKDPSTVSYCLISHCEGSELFSFKLDNNVVTGWSYTIWGFGSRPVPEWKTGEPDLTAYPFRTGPVPDNE